MLKLEFSTVMDKYVRRHKRTSFRTSEVSFVSSTVYIIDGEMVIPVAVRRPDGTWSLGGVHEGILFNHVEITEVKK